MRISFLVHNVYGVGGTNRTVINLAGALADRHDVEIVSVLRRLDRPMFDVDRRVPVVPLADLRPGQRDRADRRRLQPSLLLPRSEELYRHYSRLTDQRIERYLRRSRADVLIGTRPGLNLCVARFAPAPALAVAAEHMTHEMLPAQVRAEMRRYYPRLDASVTVTEGDAAVFRATTPIPGLLIRAIPNSAPAPVLTADEAGAPIVVAAGRLDPIKHYDQLVHAFAKVVADHPDWRLRIYGAGPERDGLRALVAALGLHNNVFLMGRCTPLESEWVKGSIVAVSSAKESFGMTIVEAMRCGLPVVSTACPVGPPEIISDGVDGLLVPVGDVDAMAGALRSLIEDEPRRRAMGVRARENAARYDPDPVAREYEALFEELRAAKPRRSRRQFRRPGGAVPAVAVPAVAVPAVAVPAVAVPAAVRGSAVGPPPAGPRPGRRSRAARVGRSRAGQVRRYAVLAARRGRHRVKLTLRGARRYVRRGIPVAKRAAIRVGLGFAVPPLARTAHRFTRVARRVLAGRAAGPVPSPVADCVVDPAGNLIVRLPSGYPVGDRLHMVARERGAGPDEHPVWAEVRGSATLGEDRPYAVLRVDPPVLSEGRWNLFLGGPAVPGAPATSGTPATPGTPAGPPRRLRAGIRDTRRLLRLDPKELPVVRYVPYRTADGFLAVRTWVRQRHAECGDIWYGEETITVEGRLVGESFGAVGPVLNVIRRAGTGHPVIVSVPGTSGGGADFRFEIPLRRLADNRLTRYDDWDLVVRSPVDGEPIRLARLLDDLAERKPVYVYPGTEVLQEQDPDLVEETPLRRVHVKPYLTVDSELSFAVSDR